MHPAITYTVAFSNTGAITATNVVITDVLSANITGANFTSSGAALTQVPGSRYVWTAPDLLQNDGGVITMYITYRYILSLVFKNAAP